MIDLHSHLVPGVDDGAADADQARAALRAMRDQGVHTLVTTPHLDASGASGGGLQAWAQRVDPAWEVLRALAAEEGVRVERGAEVMLDVPAPDLSDPRVRLAGTAFVLVEFSFMSVPPYSVGVLAQLALRGWTPVLAHPERYRGLNRELVDAWRAAGVVLQVNAGSLLGRYGPDARGAAWDLLRLGMAGLLCSDYHARGVPALAAATAALAAAGGAEQAVLLTEVNGARLLAGEPPLPVPPLGRRGFFARVFGLDR